MSRRTAAWLATSAWTFSVVLTGLGLVLLPLNHSREIPVDLAVMALGFLAFPTVGALIAFRRPGNSIGWILCAIGIIAALSSAGAEYVVYTLATNPGSLPGGMAVAPVMAGLYAPAVALIVVFLPLLFPDGRLPSPRWRPVAWSGALYALLAMVYNGLKPGPLEIGGLSLRNPTGISGAAAFLPLIELALIVCLLVAGLGTAIAVTRRLRRARGVERQQLKWFSYAVVLLILLLPLGDFFPELPNLAGFTFPVLPVAVGVAILKHRLYDIDRIINRTLVYAALTVLLALFYYALVVGLQNIIGSEEQPPLVVAASTLAAAALFRPARARIQRLIDRSFNRRKYNAALTIDSFSARLRDEIDLDALSNELVRVVRDTMEPTRVYLWLRAPS